MPADVKELKADLQRRMDGAMELLRKEFSGLRTGRASPALLEPIRVEAYGTAQPLNQVANVSIAGPGLLSVQVWDKKHEIGEDDAKHWHDEVQKLTDHYVKLVDTTLAEKEKDIRQV